ncbi:MAG: hypothetical protein GF404_01860 [candidate division Zixibacteria bacterium]|nr:hypothetical protein [candidate division Zixibacteria bacterium]
MEDKLAPESISQKGGGNTKIKERRNSIKELYHSRKYLFIALGLISIICSLFLLLAHTTEYTASVMICPAVQHQVKEYFETEGDETVLIREHIADLPLAVYPSLLRSPEVQRAVVRDLYEIGYKYGKYRINLMEYFVIEDITYAFEKLNEITTAKLDAGNSAVKLSVRTRHPELSRQILDNYVHSLKKYITQWNNLEFQYSEAELISRLDYIYKRASDEYRMNMNDFIFARQGSESSDRRAQSQPFISVNEGYTLSQPERIRFRLSYIPLIAGVLVIIGTLLYYRRLSTTRVVESAEDERRSDNDDLQYELEIMNPRLNKNEDKAKFKAITLMRGPESVETKSGQDVPVEKQEQAGIDTERDEESEAPRPDQELARIYEMGGLIETVDRPDRLNQELLDIVNEVEPAGDTEAEDSGRQFNDDETVTKDESVELDKKKTARKKKSATAKSKSSKTKSSSKTKAKTATKKTTSKKTATAKAKSAPRKSAVNKPKTESSKAKTSKREKVKS